jgi:multiple sugar transport system ATP-binding protein
VSEPRIRLDGVVKRFATVTAVERLDLAVARGEFVVLVGPSGCGKTTTLRMIAGLEMPTEGRITIDSRDVTALPPGQRDTAFVFQMFALYPHLTAEENIAFPLRAAGVPTGEVKRRTDQVIRRLEIGALRRRKPRQLSGGDQQRVSLARAMVREPKAFLMDEPLGTLDADQRERTRQIIRQIHNELSATTVFVTHDQLEAMALADRIAVMNQGRLLQFDPPRVVYDHPADLFVAHFIGSPGMNFIPIVRQGRSLVVQGLPQATMELTATAANDAGALTLGIRPEHVHIGGRGLESVVEHTELLGAYNLVELRLGEITIKARVPADQRFGEGERVRARLDAAGQRWFDPISGKALPREEVVHSTI